VLEKHEELSPELSITRASEREFTENRE